MTTFEQPPVPSVPPPAPVPAGKQTNKLALAAGILGIAFPILYGIGFFFVPLMCLAVIAGLVGLILGIIGLNKINKNPAETGKGWAIAGIVLGGLSVLMMCISVILIPTLLGPVIGNVFSDINSGLGGY